MVKFQNWLDDKHEDIDVLNELWGTDFDSFESVFIEELEHTTLGYDWSVFNMSGCNLLLMKLRSTIQMR